MIMQLKTLTLSELTQSADRWDDLWLRSAVGLPTKRAAGISHWCRSFAPDAEFSALVVTDNDRLVAGLPLIRQRGRWPLTVFRLPSNCTVAAGDLLIDPSCDVDVATKMMAQHVGRLAGCLAAFEGIEIDSDRWRRMIGALRGQGRAMHQSHGFDVGVADILGDWDAYTASWSRNHRSAIKRSRKKLEAQGRLEVERVRDASDEELHAVLEACYAIEDKGWKGENGTSILRTPGLAQYYHQEARLMRDEGMLDLWLLKLDDRIIAFEYCHYGKGTCFSHKISFDPQYERFSPGRVLRCLQLQQYHQDPQARLLDTLGVLCEAKAKWITRSYRSSRLFVALGGRGSNLLLRALQTARALSKRIRSAETDSAPTIKPGAQRYLQTASPAPCPKTPAPGPAAPAAPPIAGPLPATLPQQSRS